MSVIDEATSRRNDGQSTRFIINMLAEDNMAAQAMGLDAYERVRRMVLPDREELVAGKRNAMSDFSRLIRTRGCSGNVATSRATRRTDLAGRPQGFVPAKVMSSRTPPCSLFWLEACARW